MTTVLVVGRGGREHALARALAASPRVGRVLVAPGNAGTAQEPGCENVDVAADDLTAGVLSVARRERVGLVVVGPEDPLVDGIVDHLRCEGVFGFGPTAACARLEGSKAFAKAFLERHGIPTGSARVFRDANHALAHLAALEHPPVVKASGLAAGKGVIVAESHAEAAEAVRAVLVDRRFGSAGDEILLEQRLYGTEASVLAFCDGDATALMPVAQDHKRLLDRDRGPNTGGMGAFVPSPVVDDDLLATVQETIIDPTLSALRAAGTPYRGVLYAGLMITATGAEVIEFNCRLGDPETQAVLPLLESDLLDVLVACADGSLADIDLRWSAAAATTVVMAASGYPVSAADPVAIAGLDAAAACGCEVYHAGTTMIDGVVHASGGRVLAITATGSTIAEATRRAYDGVSEVEFEGAQHRSDIAATAIADIVPVDA